MNVSFVPAANQIAHPTGGNLETIMALLSLWLLTDGSSTPEMSTLKKDWKN
jgi:hypothetical protein